jgi:hypothetical protein
MFMSDYHEQPNHNKFLFKNPAEKYHFRHSNVFTAFASSAGKFLVVYLDKTFCSVKRSLIQKAYE